MYTNHNDPLESLIHETNQKKILSFTDRKKLIELLEKEPAIHIAHIIRLDLKKGKACQVEINEWARKRIPILSTKELELIKSFLPEHYFEKFLNR